MTRDVDALNATESAASVARPVVFAKLDFATAPVYVNTSHMTLTFGDNDYLGVGNFGGVSAITETADTQATGIELSLSGVDASLLSIALNEDYQGRGAEIYLGFLDTGYSLIADPDLVFRGRMDIMPISIGEAAEIKLTVESRLADLLRPRVILFNNSDQQDIYPADKGLEFVEEMVEKQIVWKQAV